MHVERERKRLQKLGTSTRLQQADGLLQSRKKRSFTLPRLRRSSASAGDQQQQLEVARSAEDAARVQKAAAWQWYTRGVGDHVVTTKRPLVGKSPPSQAPLDDKCVDVGDGSKAGESILTNKNNVLRQKKPLDPPLAHKSPRAASRFKSEASFARPPTSATPSAPSAAPATPLYDEVELSGLRSQMTDFVQRLQHHQTKDNEQTAAVAEHENKAKPLHNAFDGSSIPAAAASVSTDHYTAMANYHQLTKPLPPSATPVPFGMRPFSALHRLFRKVVSGSIIKSTKNFPLMVISSPEVYEPKVFPGENSGQYHYHHYIHHHHHHYQYGESPEESAAILRSRRRHSESSGSRPLNPSRCRHSESSGNRLLTPSPWEEELSDQEAEFVENSPTQAYPARRRRHSYSFSEHLTPKKAAFDEEEEMKGSYIKAASPLQLPRRHNSERFSPNKIPTMDSKEHAAQPAAGGEDEFDKELIMDIKSRRHSLENYRKGADLQKKAEGPERVGRECTS